MHANPEDDHDSDNQEENDDNEDNETSQELIDARRHHATAGIGGNNSIIRSNNNNNKRVKTASDDTKKDGSILHQFQASLTAPLTQKEMATRINELHPTNGNNNNKNNNHSTNKFLAGPIKAPTNIRTTCRFDYQPDVCKDYKDTGFCGFGDTCIYLHDRGDTLSGWQLEQQWQQEQQEIKKKQQQEQIDAFIKGSGIGSTSGATGATSSPSNVKREDDDGIPFACHLCRNHFTDPVVTNCSHYFCQSCILTHWKESSNLCPICSKDTYGVFHEPTKLLSKKRKISGRDSSWKEFQEACLKL